MEPVATCRPGSHPDWPRLRSGCCSTLRRRPQRWRLDRDAWQLFSHEQFFKENPPTEKPADAPGQFDWYGYKTEELKWFEKHGCEMIKIEAEAGDMIIWDSRTIHHASLPENNNIRTVCYAAYTPRTLASEEDLELKRQCFKKWEGTTHWPHCNIFPQGKAYRNGEICPQERDEPLEKPELTDKLLKLAGINAY